MQELRLDVVDTVALKPVFYITHALTHTSPLHRKSAADLERERGFLVLTVAATDDLSLQARTIPLRNQHAWLFAYEMAMYWLRSSTGLHVERTTDAIRPWVTVGLAGTQYPALQVKQLILLLLSQIRWGMQTLYARKIYRASDIRWSHRFEEVLVERHIPTRQGHHTSAQLSIDFLRQAPSPSQSVEDGLLPGLIQPLSSQGDEVAVGA